MKISFSTNKNYEKGKFCYLNMIPFWDFYYTPQIKTENVYKPYQLDMSLGWLVYEVSVTLKW